MMLITVTTVEATAGDWCLGCVLDSLLRSPANGSSRPSANTYRDAALWNANAQAKEPITRSTR